MPDEPDRDKIAEAARTTLVHKLYRQNIRRDITRHRPRLYRKKSGLLTRGLLPNSRERDVQCRGVPLGSRSSTSWDALSGPDAAPHTSRVATSGIYAPGRYRHGTCRSMCPCPSVTPTPGGCCRPATTHGTETVNTATARLGDTTNSPNLRNGRHGGLSRRDFPSQTWKRVHEHGVSGHKACL